MDPLAATLLVLCIVLVGAMWVALVSADRIAQRLLAARVRADDEDG